jgi:hypothetical protein
LLPVQVPAWHVSVCVHALPSEHDVPFATAGFEHVPFAGLQVPGAWHWSLAVHVTGFPPVQVPAWQVSVCVQALPSLHDVPFATAGFEQIPVPVLHTPAAWHWSEATQVTGFVPVHVPAWHESVWVQAFPSLHEVPLATAGFEHAPLVVSQVPAAWHWSDAVHTTGLAPVHAPAWQVSVSVQAFPSLHDVPFAAAGFEHTPLDVLHVPATWHWSLAVQLTGFAPVHTPAWQVSVWVQALPSEHPVPFALAGFEHTPVAGLHVPTSWQASSATHAVEQVAGLVLSTFNSARPQ